MPMQPLTQSTMEVPKGPLTLRVYPGNHCQGAVYVDDSTTFAFKKGEFARESFRCEATPQGVVLHVG